VPGLVFHAWPGSIEIDGDHAAVRSYTSEVYDQAGSIKRHHGVYDDVYVRADGCSNAGRFDRRAAAQSI